MIGVFVSEVEQLQKVAVQRNFGGGIYSMEKRGMQDRYCPNCSKNCEVN